MRRYLHWPVTFLIAVMACHHTVSPQSIDEIIAGAYESVDEMDQLADLSGNIIRQELDMLLSREQAEALGVLKKTEHLKGGPKLFRKRRKAVRSETYRWTDNVIPYSINEHAFSNADKYQIGEAIKEWEKYTCLDFRLATSQDNHKIYFDDGNGCYSYVGMRSGSQKIGLARGCRFKGVIVHEIGHSVGFHHEQNRPDRDSYIRVIRQNIPTNLYYNFKKYPTSAVDTMGVPYDYNSVMHYGGRAFTMNGQYTIRTVDSKDQGKIGNRKGLSYNDIMLANKMYNCGKGCGNKRCQAGAFLGKECKCWCPGYPVKECASIGTLPTTTVGPTKTSTTIACGDKNQYCPSWADAGYCNRNTYVKTFCKKSCGFCSEHKPTTASFCRDMKTECNALGRAGYCKGNFEMFMSENCPKTCKLCGMSPGGNENSAFFVSSSVTVVAVYSVFLLLRSVF